MMLKKGAAVLALSLSLFLPYAAPAAVGAEANSAPPYWEGSDASGVIVTGAQCPLVVEKELLTVNIPEFPKCGGTEEEFAAYSATVTANYTFYNPTAYAVSAKLLFPAGITPSYAPTGKKKLPPTVTVNGEGQSFNVRHTYWQGEFDIDEDMSLVTDGVCSDDFYGENLPVKRYVVNVTVPEGEESAYYHLTLDCNPLRTRLLLEDCPYVSIKNGYASLSYRLSSGTHALGFAVVGEPITVISEKFTREKTGAEVVAGAAAEMTESGTCVFGEFVFADYSEECGVSRTDYYNGYVQMLSHEDRGKYASYIVCNCGLEKDEFLQWYEYSLEIPAGGRVQNSVTTPLFPAIDGKERPRYVYTYLLSPAQKWADFRQIEIEINTPYHLESSTLDFEKEGECYRFSRDALPQGELVFTLTETENLTTGATPFNVSRLMPRMQRTIIIVIALAILAVTITAVSLARVRGKRRDTRESAPPEEKNGSDDRDERK